MVVSDDSTIIQLEGMALRQTLMRYQQNAQICFLFINYHEMCLITKPTKKLRRTLEHTEHTEIKI